MRRLILISTACVAMAFSASVASAATAILKNEKGQGVGSVTLTEFPAGVLLEADLRNLPPGEHGFHIHETGRCAPDFGAAGGHFAGSGAKHGFKATGGPHAGDMPNIHVPQSGALIVEVFNSAITLHDGERALFDGDGSAIVVHAGADDYESQPSGDAGSRIACGVISQ